MKLTPFDSYVKVVAVSGGKNTVQLPGKNEYIGNVPSTNPCVKGQWLPMRKIKRDRQQPVLISPRRRRKKVGWIFTAFRDWLTYGGDLLRSFSSTITGTTVPTTFESLVSDWVGNVPTDQEYSIYESNNEAMFLRAKGSYIYGIRYDNGDYKLFKSFLTTISFSFSAAISPAPYMTSSYIAGIRCHSIFGDYGYIVYYEGNPASATSIRILKYNLSDLSTVWNEDFSRSGSSGYIRVVECIINGDYVYLLYANTVDKKMIAMKIGSDGVLVGENTIPYSTDAWNTTYSIIYFLPVNSTYLAVDYNAGCKFFYYLNSGSTIIPRSGFVRELMAFDLATNAQKWLISHFMTSTSPYPYYYDLYAPVLIHNNRLVVYTRKFENYGETSYQRDILDLDAATAAHTGMDPYTALLTVLTKEETVTKSSTLKSLKYYYQTRNIDTGAVITEKAGEGVVTTTTLESAVGDWNTVTRNVSGSYNGWEGSSYSTWEEFFDTDDAVFAVFCEYKQTGTVTDVQTGSPPLGFEGYNYYYNVETDGSISVMILLFPDTGSDMTVPDDILNAMLATGAGGAWMEFDYYNYIESIDEWETVHSNAKWAVQTECRFIGWCGNSNPWLLKEQQAIDSWLYLSDTYPRNPTANHPLTAASNNIMVCFPSSLTSWKGIFALDLLTLEKKWTHTTFMESWEQFISGVIRDGKVYCFVNDDSDDGDYSGKVYIYDLITGALTSTISGLPRMIPAYRSAIVSQAGKIVFPSFILNIDDDAINNGISILK